MKWYKVSLIATSVLALAACKPSVEHRDKNPLRVDTFEVGSPLTSLHRSFNGQVMPAELTPLSFRLDGEISSILVQEGDTVAKGQVVAILDDAKAKQNLTDAQAKYELALKQFKRGQDLRFSKMISSAELDELGANFKLAEANLNTAKLRVVYTRLKAPFDGVVSSVDKQNFENTSPGETVVAVYQEDKVYVKLNVSDTVLAMLKPELSSDSYQPTVTFAGHDGTYTISYLEHTSELHPDSKTYEFWLSMPQIEQRVLPGTSAQVSVDLVKAGLNTIQGYQLPITAVDTGVNPQDFFTWKLENNIAHRYPIAVSEINGSGALVTGGINAGDVIINSHLRKLREGMEIKGAQQ
ncbi:membrane protein [Vibrio neptunius]|uniref:efflux RND transporter periplasmic adaptor subunit n=1 Tax=Vibrio neptunius TaxID=170651 RepID=UPI0005FA6F4A|nr:efflux RND transporter periplasmic adaptor subunit [Vibrio neptunius]KJY87249.1 membrane protein [Vibrio neptunius]